MKTILTHACDHRVYLPVLHELSNNNILVAGSLHESIFDLYHRHKPDLVILPIYEYTNEFHEFVDTFKDKTDIILFCGEVKHNELYQYCDNNNIKRIIQSDSDDSNLVLSYKYLYDPNIFKNMNSTRVDKILTVLSSDNNYNHHILDQLLYPNPGYPIVLINNQDFNHPQNIGTAGTSDMSILMNKYSYLLDLSGLFYIESQACGINNIIVDDKVSANINNRICYQQEKDIETYSIQNFVNNKLLSFIGE